MKVSSLQILNCPSCGGELKSGDLIGGDSVLHGRILCLKCNKDFIIEEGIAKFISSEELSGDNKATEKFYNLFSPFYDLFNKTALLLIGGHKSVQREYLSRLDIKKGDRVLEISVGTGANIPFLSGYASEIFGLDLSAGQLRRCVKNLKKWKLGTELFLGNAEELPFKDECFDVVFHIGGINFFNDKEKAIKEMIRVARPGTKILLVDESEKGRKFYENVGLKFWKSEKDVISPPVDFVPRDMRDIKLESIWKGYGYCIQFTKP